MDDKRDDDGAIIGNQLVSSEGEEVVRSLLKELKALREDFYSFRKEREKRDFWNFIGLCGMGFFIAAMIISTAN